MSATAQWHGKKIRRMLPKEMGQSAISARQMVALTHLSFNLGMV
jgi:hypothetical protein